MNHRMLTKIQLADVLAIEVQDIDGQLAKGQIPGPTFEHIKCTEDGTTRELRWSSFEIDKWFESGMPCAEVWDQMKMEAAAGA